LPDDSFPLAGLRVLSFGTFVAGNTFAMMLAELGADVVKLESLQRPDPVRMRFSGDQEQVLEPSGIETTALFGGLSRSVRDLSLNMKASGATEVLLRLAGAADVLFENFGAGVLAGWGAGWPALHAVNPRLVMVSVSGYGRTGPRARHLAYGGNVCSFSGLTYLWGASHGSIYDYIAATHAAAAALAALALRDRTGEGTYIDLGQTDTAAAMLASLLLDQLNGGPDPLPPGNEVPGSWLSGVYRCAGPDRWVAIEATDACGWAALGQLADHPVPAPDPPDQAARAQLSEAVAAWAATLTPWQAARIAQRAGLAAAPVQDAEDLWRDPQLRWRRSIVPVAHPDLGTFEYPAPVHRMTRTPAGVRGHAPRLGQDSRAVMSQWLGMDDAEFTGLVAAGVLGTDDSPAGAPPAAMADTTAEGGTDARSSGGQARSRDDLHDQPP
jgi:crotonobetainyl-CoA:carnitine CoA-transferase CaiB-like acyl-CoA transferase